MNSSLNNQTLGDLMHCMTQRDPRKLVNRCSSTEWNYREFDDICNRFNAGLASIGVEGGEIS